MASARRSTIHSIEGAALAAGCVASQASADGRSRVSGWQIVALRNW